jgi:hypothetical protein
VSNEIQDLLRADKRTRQKAESRRNSAVETGKGQFSNGGL